MFISHTHILSHLRLLLILCITAALASCSVTKYVPDGEYLLNKVDIKSDVKDIGSDELKSYLRQTPNAGIFGAWKTQVNIYSLSGPDTTKKWNRFLRKIGTPPEIYDPNLKDISREQITQAMHNHGYYDAVVTDSVDTHRHKKANIYFRITGNTPYRIHDYDIHLNDSTLNRMAADSTRRIIHTGDLFDVDKLEAERERLATNMRRRGYYNFNKDYIHFLADSSLNTHDVDVNICLRPYVMQAADSVRQAIFSRYTIRRVVFVTNMRQGQAVDSTHIDSIVIDRYTFIHIGKRLLRPHTLIDNCLILPGGYYNEARVNRTYEALNMLGPIRYVNISFHDIGQQQLDCYIVITPNKKQTFSIEAEGTFSAGDFGVRGLRFMPHTSGDAMPTTTSKSEWKPD